MTTEAQLKELSDKLAALEQQLLGRTGASASAGASSAAPGQITIKLPRKRKLRKFEGSQDDHAIEEWILDAERATAGHTDADAVDFLMYHLERVPREEVRLRPPEERANKAAIFEILCSVFGEGPTSTQALRTFFERRQKERERIQEYSHALLLLLACVEHLDLDGVHNKDKLLWDQSLHNLKDL